MVRGKLRQGISQSFPSGHSVIHLQSSLLMVRSQLVVLPIQNGIMLLLPVLELLRPPTSFLMLDMLCLPLLRVPACSSMFPTLQHAAGDAAQCQRASHISPVGPVFLLRDLSPSHGPPLEQSPPLTLLLGEVCLTWFFHPSCLNHPAVDLCAGPGASTTSSMAWMCKGRLLPHSQQETAKKTTCIFFVFTLIKHRFSVLSSQTAVLRPPVVVTALLWAFCR